ALNTSEVTGQHSISPAGVNLAAASGLEQLSIDLSSPGSGTTQKLLGPGGVSLRSLSPPPGDGISSTAVQGGSGGALEFSFPKGTTNVTPDVRAYVNAQAVTAGGDVPILATSSQPLAPYSSHPRGGGLHVGEVGANVNLTNKSLASVGSGSSITAGGTFDLATDFATNGELHADSRGGGAIAVLIAKSNETINSQSNTEIGSN